jgi:3-oxoacyl-[acyl-carrier protein] reductase
MKKVIITGASSGVGRSIAKYLFSCGYYLILVSRRSHFLKEDFGLSDKVDFYESDLSDTDKSEKVFDRILSNHPYVPYLINNAGVMKKEMLRDINWRDLEQDINVNARMPLYIMNTFLRGMIHNNFGRIINITSGAPLNCIEGYGRYSVTKAMLNVLTVTMSKEVKDYDIKINLMSPGPVRSEMAPTATLDPAVCHPTLNYLLNLDSLGPTGRFFWMGYEIPLTPQLQGVNWMEGSADNSFKKII